MSQYWILAAILLPILGGILIPRLPFRTRRPMLVYTEAVVLLTSAIVGLLLLQGSTDVFDVVHFVGDLSISFKIDGMTMVFSGLIAVLWPLATLYAFEYMEHEHRKNTFFMFYIMTYGVTLGIALSANMLTMYIFYELLTLVTLPLVIHELGHDAMHAGRKYLRYSLGGSALAFLGLVFLILTGYCSFFSYTNIFPALLTHSRS